MSAAPRPDPAPEGVARFPFPLPNGLLPGAFSEELAPGTVKSAPSFGRELVAWRDDAGAAPVLDAHCPHLGAHLGVGGRVEAPEALPSITVDTDRMTQVLNNLVSNALRYTADGETVLAPGDLICFPSGPEGAHKVSNRAPQTALVAMLSTKSKTALAIYPDSDKIGIWSGDGEVKHLFPRAAAVDYWHNEL